jgi:hypothetical protein
MVRLYGREFSRRALESFVGHVGQVGGIRAVELAAGRERGVRAFDVDTGAGFVFTVLADRALDITRATFNGKSLAYLSPAGQAHPAYYDPHGAGWLHTFPGGLVTTCGLAHLGAPVVDDGVELGLHGRVSTLPADELGYWGEWQGDDYWMHLQGTLTEGAIFGNPLRLTRRISARLGVNALRITDTVENLGGTPTPHMLLYHCNFGFPLLAPEAQIVASSRRVTPRDAAAESGVFDHAGFQPPEAGYAEQVFFHDMVADNAGDVRVALINRGLDGGLGVGLTYHQASLPYFTQWKQMGFGSYVLGLEPGNCQVLGRPAERAAGRLRTLQPSEQVTTHLEFTVLDSLPAIEEFETRIREAL